MSLKPVQKSQNPSEIDNIYNTLPKSIRNTIPGSRYPVPMQSPTNNSSLRLFKVTSTDTNRLTIGTLKTPNSVKKNSKPQFYIDDFDLNIGSSKWAVGDQISGMTSVQDSVSSGLSSDEPASVYDSFHQRKRAPTIINIKKTVNQGIKRQGTLKLKELVRRKSCSCSECGGLSELEKKTVYIPSNHKFPQKIQQKIDEAKGLMKSPTLKPIHRFNETYNNRRLFSPLTSKRKENKSLHKLPSGHSQSRKGSANEEYKGTPKAEERRHSAFNKLAEVGTPKAGGGGAFSEAGFNSSITKLSELENSIDFEKKSAISLVRLQSYHTQEAQSVMSGIKTPGSTNKSGAFSAAWDLQENANRNASEGGLSKFATKDRILRALTHQHKIPRSPVNNNEDQDNPRETLPVIYSTADFATSTNHIRRDSYLSVKSPHEKGHNHSVENLSPSDLFEIKDPVIQETVTVYNNAQIDIPPTTEQDNKETKRVNKHKVFITQKIHSNKPTAKYISISQRASPGTSPMPISTETNSSAFINESTVNLEGALRSSLGSFRVNTKSIKKKMYLGANFSQPSSPGESFRASHIKTLSVSQLAEKLNANMKKHKGNKKTSKPVMKIAINNSIQQTEPQKTLLSAKNKTMMSSPGATWRFNSVATTPKLLQALEKHPVLSGKEKMMIETYSPKLKEKLNFKTKGEKLVPVIRGKSSHARVLSSDGKEMFITSTR